MAWGRKREGGGCVGWLALLLAVLALVVAWAAYRRTGGEVGTVLKDAGVESRGAAGADSDLTEWREDLAQARDRLLGRRAEVAGGPQPGGGARRGWGRLRSDGMARGSGPGPRPAAGTPGRSGGRPQPGAGAPRRGAGAVQPGAGLSQGRRDEGAVEGPRRRSPASGGTAQGRR